MKPLNVGKAVVASSVQIWKICLTGLVKSSGPLERFETIRISVSAFEISPFDYGFQIAIQLHNRRFDLAGALHFLPYWTAIVAVLLVTVPSADLTTKATLLPVGAFCGTTMLI